MGPLLLFFASPESFYLDCHFRFQFGRCSSTIVLQRCASTNLLWPCSRLSPIALFEASLDGLPVDHCSRLERADDFRDRNCPLVWHAEIPPAVSAVIALIGGSYVSLFYIADRTSRTDPNYERNPSEQAMPRGRHQIRRCLASGIYRPGMGLKVRSIHTCTSIEESIIGRERVFIRS